MPIAVAANLIPKNSAKWPLVEDAYLRGGLRVVADATARNATYTDSAARQGLKTGQLLVTANDLRIWQYTGAGTWAELKKNVLKSYSFDTPGMVWEIPHNVKSRNFVYTVFDADGYQIVPNECHIVDDNNLTLTFLEDVAGSITLSFNV